MRETISVNCNHCGAVLEVDESTRFVTCRHCGSKLEIKRDPSSIFTTVIERIDQNTASTARDVEVIRLEHELERIDREWQQQHERPSDSPAGGIVAVVVLVLFIAFGISFATSANSMGAPAIFPIFGIGFVVIGLVAGVSVVGKMLNPNAANAEQTYQQRRARVIAQIDAARRREQA